MNIKKNQFQSFTYAYGIIECLSKGSINKMNEKEEKFFFRQNKKFDFLFQEIKRKKIKTQRKIDDDSLLSFFFS